MLKSKFFIHNHAVYQVVSEPMMHPEGEFQIVAVDMSSVSPSVFGVESIDTLYDDHSVAFEDSQSGPTNE